MVRDVLEGTEALPRQAWQEWLDEFLSHIPALDEVERRHGFTISCLIDLEPQLHPLLREALWAGAACRRPSDLHQAFAAIRKRLSGLIGLSSLHRRHSILGSIDAYAVVYWNLLHAVANLAANLTPDVGSPVGACI
jgi:hypothetical protein